ncbi:hypothetical protein BZG36_05260 [Bifiguratus adelaidae]|uniref:Pentacotripeptide-repeat region of PRORP domain-containing protein n=1 Tax=Bifiguratus adelaidae TaxID=1938954 RepID=A0A261XTU1_9FUNG|nr:hypothetical protein BZG36_05260 [Bifiguratus adelaidae]
MLTTSVMSAGVSSTRGARSMTCMFCLCRSLYGALTPAKRARSVVGTSAIGRRLAFSQAQVRLAVDESADPYMAHKEVTWRLPKAFVDAEHKAPLAHRQRAGQCGDRMFDRKPDPAHKASNGTSLASSSMHSAVSSHSLTSASSIGSTLEGKISELSHILTSYASQSSSTARKSLPKVYHKIRKLHNTLRQQPEALQAITDLHVQRTFDLYRAHAHASHQTSPLKAAVKFACALQRSGRSLPVASKEVAISCGRAVEDAKRCLELVHSIPPDLWTRRIVNDILYVVSKANRFDDLKGLLQQFKDTSVAYRRLNTDTLAAMCSLTLSQGDVDLVATILQDIEQPSRFKRPRSTISRDWALNTLLLDLLRLDASANLLPLYKSMRQQVIPVSDQVLDTLSVLLDTGVLTTDSARSLLDLAQQTNDKAMADLLGHRVLSLFLKDKDVLSASQVYLECPNVSTTIDANTTQQLLIDLLDGGHVSLFFQVLQRIRGKHCGDQHARPTHLLKEDALWQRMLIRLLRIGTDREVSAFLRDMEALLSKPSIETQNLLLKAYARCGKTTKAKRIVRSLEDSQQANHATYTTLMTAYANARNVGAALDVFSKLEQAGFTPDVVDFNVLLNAFSKSMVLADALHDAPERVSDIFMAMQDAGIQPDAISYRTAYRLLQRAGAHEDAATMFEGLQQCQQASTSLHTHPSNDDETEASRTFNMLLLEQLDACGVQATFASLLKHDLKRPLPSHISRMTFKMLIDAALKSSIHTTDKMPSIALAHRIYNTSRQHHLLPHKETCESLIKAWLSISNIPPARHIMRDMRQYVKSVDPSLAWLIAPTK